MFRVRLLVSVAAALIFAPTLRPQGEVVDLADGRATLDWISSSSFRFCRSWGEQKCAAASVATGDTVQVTRSETPSQIRLTTTYVMVEIDKKSGRLRVLDGDGKELMVETAAVERTGQEISVERVAAPGEAFYGLGARTDASADASGQVIEGGTPFFISSRGYGLHHVSPGSYRFDMARTNAERYRITLRPGLQFEYYFYFGPTPKSVLEEHALVAPARGARDFDVLSEAKLPRAAARLPSPAAGSWAALADTVHALVNASMSGVSNPAFDLAPYRHAPAALFRRAMQVAAVVPLVFDSLGDPPDDEKRSIQEGVMRWRRSMIPFFLAYVDETNNRGLPLIHPLALQFPSDPQAGAVADEFMVGDEILFAPLCTESDRRSVYFPMGNWTGLRSNKVYPGRKRVEIEAASEEMPLFVRNGSILPLESDEAGGPMVLHYMPKLAAEFFLFEPDTAEYSQLHAAPALDLMRLEIASKKSRTYEWIVHHMPAPRKVQTGETPGVEVKDRKLLRSGAWYYDAPQENIHIRVEAAAGETPVTHISF
ncbi:MAG: hypothetical protein EHM65_00815 [Acidobacteriales bacterium]|nr:MAG: hypothetical protein EHM65_00815 [Terriglobales bacterium]